MKACFSDNEIFTTHDITAFYRSFDPKLKKSTINWRVYHLVQEGVLERVGRGVFKLGQKKTYQPTIGSRERTIAALIQSNFPYLNYCIWNTSVINQFMVHQPFHFMDMVEVEKDAASSVFHFLKDGGYSVFLKPGREIMDNYLPDAEKPIIIKPLITEAPIQEIEEINTITIEKLLVDLFCDTDLFLIYQGVERSRIFEEAFSRYTINEKTLLRYADRRKRKGKLTEYLNRCELTLFT